MSFVGCYARSNADPTRKNDMPRWNIDNLMTHVAAAALIIDDFTVDVNDLREDLKLENKEYVNNSICLVST